MKNLYKALAEFQNEVPVIHQDTKGFNYTYSNLNTIFKVIKPLLRKHGLIFTQPLSKGCLKTILIHVESGQMLESEINLLENVSLNKMNQFQVMGSQITYLRRYSLSSLLGLITDKDIDATGIQEKKQTYSNYVIKELISNASDVSGLNEIWKLMNEKQQKELLGEIKIRKNEIQ